MTKKICSSFNKYNDGLPCVRLTTYVTHTHTPIRAHIHRQTEWDIFSAIRRMDCHFELAAAASARNYSPYSIFCVFFISDFLTHSHRSAGSPHIILHLYFHSMFENRENVCVLVPTYALCAVCMCCCYFLRAFQFISFQTHDFGARSIVVSYLFSFLHFIVEHFQFHMSNAISNSFPLHSICPIHCAYNSIVFVVLSFSCWII